MLLIIHVTDNQTLLQHVAVAIALHPMPIHEILTLIDNQNRKVPQPSHQSLPTSFSTAYMTAYDKALVQALHASPSTSDLRPPTSPLHLSSPPVFSISPLHLHLPPHLSHHPETPQGDWNSHYVRKALTPSGLVTAVRAICAKDLTSAVIEPYYTRS